MTVRGVFAMRPFTLSRKCVRMREVRYSAFAALLWALLLTAQPRTDRAQPGPWKRYVTTPKGAWFDTPIPHSLAYFTRYPAILDESGDFCYRCSPQKKMAMAMAAKEPKAEVHVVGKINGLTIHDVFYRFQSESAIDWKSILVHTGPDSYREIYHDEPNEGKPNPSFLVKVGEEAVLGVSDNQYRMDEVVEFWCFGADGPLQLDFKPAWEAAREVIPADQFIVERPAGDFPNRIVSVPTLFRGSGGPCCEVRGLLKVKFKMQQCRITVTGTDFVPK
jgi:hypothetical protein